MTKRIISLVLSILMCVSFFGCGKRGEVAVIPQGFGGEYYCEAAYGMENFYSEIDFDIHDMEFDYEVEHFGEEVEEDEGKFTVKDNIVTLIGKKNGTKTLKYNPDEKTLYSEEMDTTWVHSSQFVKSLKPEGNSAEGEGTNSVEESVFGTYKYSNEALDAEIVIDRGGYKLTGKTKLDDDTFDESGKISLQDNLLVFDSGEGTVSCEYDAEKGTINYEGMIFTKEK